ncbi:hypothetical protein [uncultured Friedmanniella sp.]|uniref:hypothetical protein n=1 Tax=uncultured Friedmanniella sp. TaxID=335381 RepID=UPI0035CC4E29
MTALALLLAGAVPGLAAAKDTVAFTIHDNRITESSGLARDTASQLYWTTNDSGSAGVVYGIGTNGKVRGTLRYRAPITDVEAVAVHGNRLYVADIGDSTSSRSMVTVDYFLNPRANGLTVTYNAYDFRYPDGAHDAETLLVDGAGRLYVVTKGATGAVYEAPKTPSRDTVNKLTKVGAAPALVTDGVFLPGNRQIALLTPTSVVVLDARTYQQVATASIPKQRQAESLAVNLAGDGLLVGSEGANSLVYAMAVPGAASASASATPSPSASAGSGDSGDEDVDATPATANRRGTYLALGLAGLVALVAGVVVALARRP